MDRSHASVFVSLPESMLRAFGKRFSDMRFVWQQMDALAKPSMEGRPGEMEGDQGGGLGCLRLKSIRAMPTDDAGDHALSVLGSFELYLHLAGKGWSLSRAWQRLEELVVFMHQNRWESLVGAASVQSVVCLPKSFPEERTPACLACLVEWEQQLLLGPPERGQRDVIPSPRYSHAPRTGLKHEADYLPLERKQ